MSRALCLAVESSYDLEKSGRAMDRRCEIVVDDTVLVTRITPTPKEHPKDGRVWWRHTFTEKERKFIDGYRVAAMPFAMRVVER